MHLIIQKNHANLTVSGDTKFLKIIRLFDKKFLLLVRCIVMEDIFYLNTKKIIKNQHRTVTNTTFQALKDNFVMRWRSENS